MAYLSIKQNVDGDIEVERGKYDARPFRWSLSSIDIGLYVNRYDWLRDSSESKSAPKNWFLI